MPIPQPAQEHDTREKPKPVLRWAKPLGNGEFETTVLLFKGSGNFLQGFINVKGEKRQVLAHLNERKPDPETGEVKPNYLTLSEPHGHGEDTKWTQIGHGNAINRRADGKPVYYDEILLNVGGEVLRARVTPHAGHELHRQLGFTSERLERPAFEPRQDTDGPRAAESATQPDHDDTPAAVEARSVQDIEPSESTAAMPDRQPPADSGEESSAKKVGAPAAKDEAAGAKKSRRRKSVTTH